MADTPAYQALARKWRPQTFDDVVAQPQVTQTLKNALASGRIHHAYLFCGPRGTGKTTTARILAKALNCVNGPTPTPCNECVICRSITNGSNLDVLEIDAASNTGVDQIRDLRDSTMYVPAQSRFKIYIIDEVHRLSASAKDALLKTLEEPPPQVKFIFATTEAHEVPQTVRSRSLRLDFHLLSQDALRIHLENIAAAEKIPIDREALDVIATEAAGSVRDSLSLLDQIAAYSGGRISAELANEALGLVDSQILFSFTDAVAAGDVEKSLDVVAQVSRAGRDHAQFARQLAEHLKRLLFAKSLGERFADEGLGSEQLTQYRATAAKWDENDLLRLLLMSVEIGHRVRKGAAQPRLELELFAMRAAKLDRSIDIKALVERIEAQGGRTGSREAPALFDGPANPAPTTITRPPERKAATAPAPVTAMPAPAPPTPPSPAVESAAKPSGDGDVDFAPILEAICEQRPTLRSVLGHAELARTAPGIFELRVPSPSPFQQKQLTDKPVRDLIHSQIIRFVGTGARVTMHVKAGGAPPPRASGDAPRPAPRVAQEGLLADHGLQEILRRFDGEIVE